MAGASPTWLATSPEVEGISGAFFVKRQRVQTAPHATDPERYERLWEESARLVGLPSALESEPVGNRIIEYSTTQSK